MLAVYIVTAIIGGALVLVSAIMGTDDAGHFGDTDFDGLGGHDGMHSDLVLPFLSLRFWTYFCAGFGLTGLLLTLVAGRGEPFTALVSAGVGAVAGLATFLLMRHFSERESDAGVQEEHLVGKEARVLVGLGQGKEGKVRIEVKGEIVDITAYTLEDVSLAPGDRALVVSLEGGKANVVSLTALLEENI